MNNQVAKCDQPSAVEMSEWYSKQWEIHQASELLRNDAFNQRQNGRLTRFETEIKTKWDNYMNNTRIADRITELSNWQTTMRKYFDRINNEIQNLQDEKVETEHDLDQMFIPLKIVTQCMTIRETRRPTELTNDDAGSELKNELITIDRSKETLIEKIQMIHEKLNSLENVKHTLEVELKDKEKAIEIDQRNFILNENSINTDYRSTVLESPKKIISYEAWLEHCRAVKHLAEEELADIYTFKEALKMTRHRIKNDIKSQRDTTDFALRKRVYQTRKVKSELDWQKLKVQKEMNVLLQEIERLEKAIINKGGFVKCAETRTDNRKSRPEFELCLDELQEALEKEVNNLYETKNNLTCKYNDAKTAYKNLEQILHRLEKDLDNKDHTLTTDIMCLDTRCPLKDKNNELFDNQTNSNVAMMKMGNEVSLES